LITSLLILHALCAVFMLGALTHQTASVWWPPGPGDHSFLASFRAVRGSRYCNFVILSFVVTAGLGAVLYPPYRLGIRVVLEDLRLNWANGMFELKEHFVALGLGLLPAYWFYWRQPVGANVITVRMLTTLLAFIVWWGFIVGHILNNIRGFGS
jgi:hypothetical protein